MIVVFGASVGVAVINTQSPPPPAKTEAAQSQKFQKADEDAKAAVQAADKAASSARQAADSTKETSEAAEKAAKDAAKSAKDAAKSASPGSDLK